MESSDDVPEAVPLRDAMAECRARLAAETPEEQKARRERWKLEEEERDRIRHQEQIAASRRHFMSFFGRRYENCTLDGFEISGIPEVAEKQRRVVDALREYSENMVENVKSGRNIVLFGPPGTGKDHLMVALMIQAWEMNGNVRWENGMDFYADVRDRMDESLSEAGHIQQMTAPHVLAISDPLPPWGPVSPFQAQVLFRVIDRRYRDMKPIWTTMNVSGGKEAGDRLGSAIVDRLKDKALSLHCDWPSYRSPAA